MALFALKWNCHLPKCNDNAMKSYLAAEQDYDLVLANVAISHCGCFERAPGTQRASGHRAVHWTIAHRSGTLVQFQSRNPHPLMGWRPGKPDAACAVRRWAEWRRQNMGDV